MTSPLSQFMRLKNKQVNLPDHDCIPGHCAWNAIKPIKQKTWLEEQNIDVNAVNTADEYVLLCQARSRDYSNKYSHLQDDAIVRMISNLGKIRPVA